MFFLQFIKEKLFPYKPPPFSVEIFTEKHHFIVVTADIIKPEPGDDSSTKEYDLIEVWVDNVDGLTHKAGSTDKVCTHIKEYIEKRLLKSDNMMQPRYDISSS